MEFKMKVANFVLDDYLKRIGFSGKPTVDINCLMALMRCQLFSIPFENIDVQINRQVSLQPEDIVNKIIYSNRGGYCYEVNGIFCMALSAIGFNYTLCGARPMFYPTLRPKTHVVIVVEIGDEQYLCDLGFGSYGIRSPLSLKELDKTIQQDYDEFILSKIDKNTFLVQAKVEHEWKNQFCFDLYPLQWIDMTLPNYFNSTHPDTIFVQKLLAIKYNPEGRSILVGNQLKRYQKNNVEIQEISKDKIYDFLKVEFGIDPPTRLLLQLHAQDT
jgi:N-hydroxyarylamine O-acetyltransferase